MALLAVGLAAPISIGTALIITRTLKGRSSAIVFSVVAILAAVPSVIYGALGYYVLDKFSTQILGYPPPRPPSPLPPLLLPRPFSVHHYPASQ